MEDKNISSLIKQAKSSSPKKTVQKIAPLKIKDLEETQFSFYIEKSLLKKLKQCALNNDESIKATITKSIENYLETN